MLYPQSHQGNYTILCYTITLKSYKNKFALLISTTGKLALEALPIANLMYEQLERQAEIHSSTEDEA